MTHHYILAPTHDLGTNIAGFLASDHGLLKRPTVITPYRRHYLSGLRPGPDVHITYVTLNDAWDILDRRLGLYENYSLLLAYARNRDLLEDATPWEG